MKKVLINRNSLVVIGFLVCTVFVNGRSVFGQDTAIRDTSIQSQYAMLFKKGFDQLNSGNMAKGVSLICDAFKTKNKKDHSDRVADIYDREFMSVLTDLDKGKLKKEEKALGYQFVKETLSNGPSNAATPIAKYLQQNPTSVFVQRLKFLYLLKNGSENIRSQAEKLLDLDSTIVSANIFKGKYLYTLNDFKDGIRYFSHAISADPEYAIAYYFRALGYDQLEEPKVALADFTKSIDLYPGYFDSYFNRGNVESKLNLNHEAIADFRKAAELRSDLDWPFINMSFAFRRLNMNDSALWAIQEAIYIDPQKAVNYGYRGEIYLDEQDYGSAVSDFTKGINLDPENPIFYSRRGDAYFYDDKTDEAIADFKRSFEMNKNNAYPLIRLGDCYYKLKDYNTALSYYDQSAAIAPDNVYMLVAKGLCYSSLNQEDKARDVLEKAVNADSTNYIALGNLGWAYYCLGDFEKCIYYSQKALNYQNNAFFAKYNIALSTLRMGKYQESLKLYQECITEEKNQKEKASDGAVQDLKDLIKKNIMVKEATYIVENVFHQKE